MAKPNLIKNKLNIKKYLFYFFFLKYYNKKNLSKIFHGITGASA